MNNYHAYMIVNGEEHVDHNPLDLRLAYDEAKRFKEEYNASEAGVRVFTPDIFRILSWNNGEYRKLKGHYLYTIKVGG